MAVLKVLNIGGDISKIKKFYHAHLEILAKIFLKAMLVFLNRITE